jgi:chromosome segregation ATPase
MMKSVNELTERLSGIDAELSKARNALVLLEEQYQTAFVRLELNEMTDKQFRTLESDLKATRDEVSLLEQRRNGVQSALKVTKQRIEETREEQRIMVAARQKEMAEIEIEKQKAVVAHAIGILTEMTSSIYGVNADPQVVCQNVIRSNRDDYFKGRQSFVDSASSKAAA